MKEFPAEGFESEEGWRKGFLQKEAEKHNPPSTEWDTAPETKEEVLLRLKQNPFLSDSYHSLNNEWRKRFLDFCQGKASLPLTYDPFFKRIFHPDIHPDRLSRLVSSLLDIKVRVVGAQEYCLIALDVFCKLSYTKDRQQQA